MDLLIEDLMRADSIEKGKRLQNGFDASKYKHLHEFEKFVRSLGIPGFSFFVGTNKIMNWRTLTG